MDKIKHKILVLSGKGGVGKSTVSAQLARELVQQGKKVGLLDIDLCGPSLPRILGVEDQKVRQSSEGWVPIFVDADQKLCVMSIGFLLQDKTTAVVWRGPKKTATIKQFLEDVYWSELDYLIIDTPPGTSDEHISICEYLTHFNPDGAIVVTTPQGVSLSDVRKEISFCRKLQIPLLGLIENMSGFVCPHCEECTNIFSTGGGQALANLSNIPFIGKIPIDPTIGLSMEDGKFIESKKSLEVLTNFVQSLINKHQSNDDDDMQI